jgi:hypothetical protein
MPIKIEVVDFILVITLRSLWNPRRAKIQIGRSGNIFKSCFRCWYHFSALYFFKRLCPGTVGSESGAENGTDTFPKFAGSV